MAMGYQKLLAEARRAVDEAGRARGAPLILSAGICESEEEFAARVPKPSSRIIARVPYGFKVPEGIQAVEFAPKFFEVLHPTHAYRFIGLPGGRGGGKTWAVETDLPLRMMSRRLRILCCREYQRSLRESSHHGLVNRIHGLGLSRYFQIRESEIKCLITGSEVIFAGLGVNADSLLSLEDVNLVWVEQAEAISARSLELLLPTIRAKGSQIIFTWNPDSPTAPVELLFTSDRDDMRRAHTTYRDNPWWGNTALEAERLRLLKTDPDAYAHVYEGLPRAHSSAQVFFGKYIVDSFEPGADWSTLQGCDFGFATDPSVLIRARIHEKKLFIEHEAHGYGVEMEKLPALFERVPDSARYVTRADSARPETINYMQRNGFPRMIGAAKWPSCAEEGIEYIRGAFEQIVIHERCTQTALEAKLYSFKTDRLSGDVLPQLLDRNNHCWDSVRYALEPLIRNQRRVRFTNFFHMIR